MLDQISGHLMTQPSQHVKLTTTATINNPCGSKHSDFHFVSSVLEVHPPYPSWLNTATWPSLLQDPVDPTKIHELISVAAPSTSPQRTATTEISEDIGDLLTNVLLSISGKGCPLGPLELYSTGGSGWGKFDEAQPAKIFVEEGEWRVQKNLLPFLSTFSHVWTLLSTKKKKRVLNIKYEMFNRKQKRRVGEYKTNITSYFSIKCNIITPKSNKAKIG